MEHLAPGWLRPSKPLVLSNRDVHVWCAQLDRHPAQFDNYWAILSQDERDRATQFRFERDRLRFTLCRGILRSILARYLNQPPNALQFSYSSRGKPALVQEKQSPKLEFNVSHSQQMALFAIAAHHVVGVDVEQIRPVEVLSLADRFFSPREAALLAQLPAHQQQRSFFQRWTCKEAYLKAIGTGLVGLDQAEIEIDQVGQPYLIQSGAIAQEWMITPLPVPPEYSAHLVSQSHTTSIHLWQWQPSEEMQPD